MAYVIRLFKWGQQQRYPLRHMNAQGARTGRAARWESLAPSAAVENPQRGSHGVFPSAGRIMNRSKRSADNGPGDLPIPKIQFVKGREKKVLNERSEVTINPQHVALSSRQFRYFN
ncbi:hypothetical protein AAFF_G00163080 [Aldrovandia affinis]|uniref:Uncharacterized protein n=1 Tax=Aldrovandia affinis TaxID=143900 RepID=A0AAD7SZ88_9TELE|nr:hypothetical protein AAFF_G00163080 [Aldrovandia affinis]